MSPWANYHVKFRKNNPDEYRANHVKAGLAIQNTLKERGVCFYDPKVRARGLKTQREKKLGFFNPEVQARIHKKLREEQQGFYNSKIRSKAGKMGNKIALEVRRKNWPYWYAGVPFDSEGERQTAKWLSTHFNFIPKEGKNCHIKVNGGEIDFRVENMFIEYHPRDANRLTKQEYYEARRKLLDENGYENYPLVVIKSLDSLENGLLCHYCNLGEVCQGIPSRLMLKLPAQSAGPVSQERKLLNGVIHPDRTGGRGGEKKGAGR